MALRVSVRGLLLGGSVLAIIATAVPALLPAAGEELTPRTVAGRELVDAQVIATQRAVQRGHARALGQLSQVRQLKLAITEAQAAAIERKAKDDLSAVRREAIATVAGLIGLKGAQIEPYVVSTERELDRADLGAEPGVLLAPQLFNVVRRADALLGQIADRATRELTGSGATPSPRPTGP
ncbi:MAG TPA: hypothetical protein VGA16_01065 [Candidatus Limnocylindria bacterium]